MAGSDASRGSERRLKPDRTTVVPSDDDGGRARAAGAAIAPVSGPSALIKLVEHVLYFGAFARVLDVHEECLAIGRLTQACDLTADGAGHEAFELVGPQRGADEGPLTALQSLYLILDDQGAPVTDAARYGRDQHAVALVSHGTVVSLNPADARGLAKPDPIG